MGGNQSTLEKEDYKIEEEKENYAVATKGGDKFFVKKIVLQGPGRRNSRNFVLELISEVETLKKISHPHIVACRESFQDQNTYYVVMDYCEGGSLAAKIRGMKVPPQEFEALSWFVEICLALKTIHEKDLLHKHLMTENVFLTEFGTVCLGDFGKIHENSSNMESTTELNRLETIHYLAPEVFTEGTYDAKSDIWSVGCVLYELCTKQRAFTAQTPVKLMPKIIGGPYPHLKPGEFRPELCDLLKNILSKKPQSRPSASDILQHPFIIDCLSQKCKITVKELQTKVQNLRDLADGLERVHQGATIGSLAGGVIGAVGGVTSIVGLILTPFTLGASLIVTGVGIGVGVIGGTAAGVSNITKMVNQSSDRRAVESIIKEFEEKIKAVVTWLKEINDSLQKISSRATIPVTQDHSSDENNLTRIGLRATRGLGGIAELVRLAQVMNIGKIAAQTSRVVRIAEAATGVLSGLFLAADIFFIAMDAKEIHHIRQAKTGEEKTTAIRSEIMKFVLSVREAADNLQRVLDDLKTILASIPSLGYWEER